MPPGEPPRPPLLAVALLSTVALAHEILLMRLLAITQWRNVAAMIISLALLGYGMGGTVLSLFQQRLLRHYERAFTWASLLFGTGVAASFLLAQRVSLTPELLLWDPREAPRLLAVYLALAVPFLFAGGAIALTLARFAETVSRVYAADLAGAALGSAAVVALLLLLAPLHALGALAILGVMAAPLGAWELRMRGRGGVLAAALGLAAALALLVAGSALEISPYKALAQALRVDGATVLAVRSSPLGLVHAVENRRVPTRHAPGLGLAASREPPPQIALFADADAAGVVTRHDGDLAALEHLDQVTSAVPYHLGAPRRVLVPGAGGGRAVLQALAHGAGEIDAVELDPQLVDLVRNDFADFAGRLYDLPQVRVHVADARAFVTSTDRRFDLIQLELLEGGGPAAAGRDALAESRLHTVEALRDCLARLEPGGFLALTRHVSLPPREALKLLATAVAALELAGDTDPAARMVLLRSWQTSTLVIKSGPFTDAELERLRGFAAARGFDLAHYPGMPRTEANRFAVLREPLFFDAARELLGPGREAFVARYKFDIAPATDDRPFFGDFFRWSTLPELWRLRSGGGMPLVEWGYLVSLATLLQALLASAVLILLPLFARGAAGGGRGAPPGRLATLAYFSAVGVAFLLVEISLIQRFTLYLHQPVYAAAAVLTACLLFAGLGSAWSRRLGPVGRLRRPVRVAAGAIALIGAAHLVALDRLFAATAAWPIAARAGLAVALVAPLAFGMGIPFPSGLRCVAAAAPRLLPWAWAVNGCASVLGAVAAPLVAAHAGFSGVVALAAALYLLAALGFPAADAARDRSGSPRGAVL